MPIKKLVNWGLLLAISLTVALVSAEIFVRVAANIWFDVKYLATAGVGNMPRAYASLEDFLGEFWAQLAPHRIWNNYYANSLGFTGRELSVAKPVGTAPEDVTTQVPARDTNAWVPPTPSRRWSPSSPGHRRRCSCRSKSRCR